MQGKLFFLTLCILLALSAFAASGEEPVEIEGITGPGEVAEPDTETPQDVEVEVGSSTEGESASLCRPLAAGTPDGQEATRGNWDPATCGACGDFCSSDNACYGRLLGDRCNNNGGTCQAFTGCALFNCCRCT